MWCSTELIREYGWGAVSLTGWEASPGRGPGLIGESTAEPFVLIIDRLPGVVTLVELALRSRNFRVATAADYETERAVLRGQVGAAQPAAGEPPAAEPEAAASPGAMPDVALIGLTGADLRFGAEAARIVREIAPETPIVLLTSTESAGLAGQTIRADDEVSAPWDLDTLEFRLRSAQAHRSKRHPAARVLVYTELRIDLQERIATAGDVTLALAGPEWRLLEMLAHAEGEAIEGETLLETIWGPAYRSDAAYLRAWVNRLNRKLEAGRDTTEPLLQPHNGGYLLLQGQGADK